MYKFKIKTSLLLVLLLLFAMIGCGNKEAAKPDEENETQEKEEIIVDTDIKEDEESGTRLIVDSTGREVEVPREIKSIICWNASALRYTSYMGAQDLVVGVEDYEQKQSLARPYNYLNFDLFKDLPVVGTNGEHYIEEALSVNPDVIVMSTLSQKNFEDGSNADQLQETLGIPVIMIAASEEMMDEDAYEVFEILGQLYNKEDRAKELIAYMDEIKEDLDKRVAAVSEEDKPTVYVGGVSFRGAHALDGTEANYGPFKAIKAKNLANEIQDSGAFNVDLEQILAWDPDVIFIDFNGMELISEDYLTNPEFYEQLKANKEGRVFSQIAFRSTGMNLDTSLINTYYAGTILYPEEFSDIDPVEKAEEIFNKFLGQDFYKILKENGNEFRTIKIGE